MTNMVIADRVLESTTTVGVGVITLAGAFAQFQTFAAAVGVGNQAPYFIRSGDMTSWEVGIGTVAGTGPYTFSRDIIIASSASNAAISLSGVSTIGNAPVAELAFSRPGKIITAGASYAAGLSDHFIEVNKTAGSATAITLPATGLPPWKEIVIKDGKGDAATNNITISAGGVTLLDGQVSQLIKVNFGYVAVKWDATTGAYFISNNSTVASLDVTNALGYVPVQTANIPVSTGALLGNSAAAGVAALVSVGTGLALTTGTLAVTGTLTGEVLASPTITGTALNSGTISGGALAGTITQTGTLALTGVATAVTQPAGTDNTTVATTAYVDAKTTTATVAAAGTTQGTATVLTAPQTVVTSGTGGVLVPAAPLNTHWTIWNRSGATITVYPAAGAQLEAAGANIGEPVANNVRVSVIYTTATQGYIG